MSRGSGATVLLVVAVALAVPLAGCIGGGGSAADDGTGSEDTLDPGNETGGDGPGTSGDRPHVHDRWDGARTFDVISDATVQLQIVDPEEPDGLDQCVASSGGGGPGQPCFGGEEVPTEGIVPPGSGWVNVTVEFDDGSFDRIDVLYQDPTTTDWEVAGRVASGGTASINITSVQQTDDGHAQLSHWKFAVQSSGNPHGDEVPYSGPATPSGDEVTVTAEAIRDSGPLPLEPPHPDYFVDTSIHRVSYIEASTQQMAQAGPVTVEQGTGSALPVSPFADGLVWRSNPGLKGDRVDVPNPEVERLTHPLDVPLVPPATVLLGVQLRVADDAGAQLPTGVDICLYGLWKPSQHPGEETELGCLTYTGGGAEETMTRSIEKPMTDSIYANHTGQNESRWSFFLHISARKEADRSTVGDFSGTVDAAFFVSTRTSFEAPSWAFEV